MTYLISASNFCFKWVLIINSSCVWDRSSEWVDRVTIVFPRGK